MAEIEIPSDVQPSIMEALPSKSLVKFLCVSKPWYSIIKSPYFLESYYYKSNNKDVLLLKAQSRYYVFRYRNPRGSRRTKVSSSPSPPPPDFERISASLDGLLFCLSGSLNPNLLLLWNPSLNKFKSIATPLTPPGSGSGSTHVVGLAGFSYNLVRIVLLTFTEMTTDLNLWSDYTTYSPPHAQVYSLTTTNPSSGSGSGWKSVALPWLGNHCVSRISQGCSLKNHNVVYWIIFRGEYVYDDDLFGPKEFGASILTYNATKDCFAEIKLPMELEQAVNPDLTLSVIADSLCIVQFPDSQPPTAVVWRMESESCWKVLYKVKLSSVSNRDLWALHKGKIFITTCCGKLIVINLQSRTTSASAPAHYYDGHVGMTGGQAFPYTESLLLMDGFQREQLQLPSKLIN